MSAHLSLDELAELDAGVLARRAAAAASRHLAGCPECGARADALRHTEQRLRDLGPLQMPADVAARLDRALAGAAASSSTDVVPDLGSYRARRPGLPRWGYAAAAAVVVLAAIGIAVGTRHHAASSSALSVEPLVGTQPPAQLIKRETGRTYTPDSIGDYATGLLSEPAQSDSTASATAVQPGAAMAPEGGSGGGSAGKLPGKSSRQNASTAVGAPAPAVAAPTSVRVPAALRHLADSRTALLRCAAYITDTPNASPLAVDFGRWTNASAGIHRVPSVVFVFADTDDADTVDVYVVAAACDASSLLDFQVLKRTP